MDIKAIAKAATDKAWAIMDGSDLLTVITLRDRPTFAHNPATDISDVSAWDQEYAGIKAFIYDDNEEQSEGGDRQSLQRTPLRTRHRMCMVRKKDCPLIIEPTTTAEILIGAVVWRADMTENPPGDAIIIFEIRP